MRSPVADLLSDLVEALDESGVDWYLFGAQAAILHGAARLTADVDVTVRLPVASSHEALAQRLERHGFLRRAHDPAFVARTRVVPLLHRRTGIPLDVVLAGPGLEDRFFGRVQHRDVEGVAVRLASPEDVIIMKVLAGRPKDVDDVIAIIAANRVTLDARYVERILTELQAALAQDDLLPVFRRAIVHAAR